MSDRPEEEKMGSGTPSDPRGELPPARPPRRTTAKGMERRRAILEAAERVFARAGYWAATTEQIAREVGLSQPAIFRYFPTKKQLFIEALSLRQREILDLYLEIHRRPITAFEKLRALCSGFVDLAEAHPNMGPLRLQAAAAIEDEDIRKAVLATVRALVAGHEALFRAAIEERSLRPDVDPTTAACTLAGLAFLFYLSSGVGFEVAATPDTARSFVARFLDGLAAG